MIVVLGGLFYFGVSLARAVYGDGFSPIEGNGQVVWASTTTRGESIILSYSTNNLYSNDVTPTLSLNFVDSEGVQTHSKTSLPDYTSVITVTGCGNFISVVVTLDDDHNNLIYIDQLEVPGRIDCGSAASVFIPLVSH